MSKVDHNYMRRDRDGSLDGRLNMSNHRISGLADPTDADDAVTRRYVASRFQALSDEVQGNKSKLGAFLSLLGVVYNQVLIMEYEFTGTDFEHDSSIRDSSTRIDKTRAYFREYPRVSDYIGTLGFFGTFTLKKILCYIYLKKNLLNITWLRIKHPGTYTIHFDLICNSFSFELHTRDEVILFSEHNPKHDINLEKDENCVLLFE